MLRPCYRRCGTSRRLSASGGEPVYQAIEMAGGLTEQASEREINLAEGITDGQKLYIYTREESEALVSSGGGGLVEISERRMAAPMPGSISTRRIRRNL